MQHNSDAQRREDGEAWFGKYSPRSPLSCLASSGASSIPETAVLEPIGRGVLDRPPSRAMTARIMDPTATLRPDFTVQRALDTASRSRGPKTPRDA